MKKKAYDRPVRLNLYDQAKFYNMKNRCYLCSVISKLGIFKAEKDGKQWNREWDNISDIDLVSILDSVMDMMKPYSNSNKFERARLRKGVKLVNRTAYKKMPEMSNPTENDLIKKCLFDAFDPTVLKQEHREYAANILRYLTAIYQTIQSGKDPNLDSITAKLKLKNESVVRYVTIYLEIIKSEFRGYGKPCKYTWNLNGAPNMDDATHLMNNVHRAMRIECRLSNLRKSGKLSPEGIAVLNSISRRDLMIPMKIAPKSVPAPILAPELHTKKAFHAAVSPAAIPIKPVNKAKPLADYDSNELIDELKTRGYKGTFNGLKKVISF